MLKDITVNYNTFDLELPTSKKIIKFRTFTVKEYELFLTAKMMNDDNMLINTLNDIITSCSFNVIDSKTLPNIDVEYLFLMLRAKSYSDFIPIQFNCRNIVDKPIEISSLDENKQPTTETTKGYCDNKIYAGINLKDIIVKFPDKYDEYRTIFINDEKTIGIKLKNPNSIIKKQIEYHNKNNKTELLNIPIEHLFDCVESIFDTERVMSPNENKSDNEDSDTEFNKNEFLEWFMKLPKSVILDINVFYSYLPSLTLKEPLTLRCNSCGLEEKIYLNNFEDFLD